MVDTGTQPSLPHSEPESASMDAAGTLDSLGAASQGLSADDAAVRLSRDWPNELPVARVRRCLAGSRPSSPTLFAVMLLVAAVITLVVYELGRPRDTGNLQLAVAILAVVLLNARDRVRAGVRRRTHG